MATAGEGRHLSRRACAFPLCYQTVIRYYTDMKKNLERRTGAYATGSAADFVDRCLADGKVAFALAELCTASGLTPSVAAKQLRRLAARVVPLYPRAGYFLIVTPEHRDAGAPPPAWWLDHFFRYVGAPYYVGLLSAAAEHGAAHQALQVVQVVTEKPRPDLTVGRRQIQFFTKRRIAETPTMHKRGAFAPLNISTPEATLFDLIRNEGKLGGIARIRDVIREMKPLSRAGFAAALQEELEIKLLQRAGFLLEDLGFQGYAKQVEKRLAGERLQPAALSAGAPINNDWRDNRWAVSGDVGASGSNP